ncbi:MAG TPA: tRNA lysidine(34) synthetase TilS [Vulgatibacter sp.]|nr:tRNA lysidine(34) synthetase TilS [Vulgatibacter sp.]
MSRLSTALERLELGSGHEVVVAFSGGADSLALLALLGLVPRRLRPSFEAVHVDHGLRPDSAADAARAAALAAGLGARCRIVTMEARGGGGLEAVARRGRYEALAAAAAGRTILTAHTADDQAETALYRLSKGTGIRGLAGIRPVVRLAGATVARPLLEVERELLRGVVEDLGLRPVEDPTNRTGAFARNRLRLEVLPALERAVGGASANLARAARLAADDERYLESRAARALARIALGGGCDAGRLARLPAALRGRIVRRLVVDAGGRIPTAAEVERVLALAKRGGELHLARGIVATARAGILTVRQGRTGRG